MARPYRTGRAISKNVLKIPDIHKRAWEVYRQEPTQEAVVRGANVSRSTAKALIEEGCPELGLPPLKEKLKALLRLSVQMDIEEGAKSMALGRAAVRKGIQKYAQAMSMLDPARIPPTLVVPQLATLVALNERLSRVEQGEQPPDFTDGDVADVLSSLLVAIASRRLPGGAVLLEGEPIRPQIGAAPDAAEAKD